MARRMHEQSVAAAPSPPPPLLTCWAELLEEPRQMPVVQRFRAFAVIRSDIQFKAPRSLELQLKMELRSYATQDDREHGAGPEVHCSCEVEGCSPGREWQLELRRRVGRDEADLRRLVKSLMPFQCFVRLGGPPDPPFEAALRLGLLRPSAHEAAALRGLGRAASPGRPMLWELWAPARDKSRLRPPFDGLFWAVRVKAAQLLDRALAREPADEHAGSKAAARLPELLKEERSCVQEMRRVASEIAAAREVIEDCRTVDLWIEEDEEEATFRRLRGEALRLEHAIRTLDAAPGDGRQDGEGRRRALAAEHRLAADRLGALEAGRRNRRRILDARARAAEAELISMDARLAALAGRSDSLFLEREGLAALLA